MSGRANPLGETAFAPLPFPDPRDIDVDLEAVRLQVEQRGEGAAQSRQHHLVPQFWLREWEENCGTFRVHDLARDRNFLTGARKVMVERDFYKGTHGGRGAYRLEGHLSAFEGEVAPIFQKLRDDGQFARPIDRAWVASFLGVQHYRGRRFQRSLTKSLNGPNERFDALIRAFQTGYHKLGNSLYAREWSLHRTRVPMVLADEPVVPFDHHLSLDGGFSVWDAPYVFCPLQPELVLVMVRKDLALLAFAHSCGWRDFGPIDAAGSPLFGPRLDELDSIRLAKLQICAASEQVVEVRRKQLVKHLPVRQLRSPEVPCLTPYPE